MEINKNVNNDELTLNIIGRLDTTTAPELEAELKSSLEGIKSLVLDLVDLDYISSAGLRVLLATQKIMNAQGSMVIKNAKPEIMEVFEITGFSEFLKIV